MKFNSAVISLVCAFMGAQELHAFAPSSLSVAKNAFTEMDKMKFNTGLRMAIGLGPGAEEEKVATEVEAVVPVEPIVEPDHEAFRDSRLSDFDKKCDDWYGKILKADEPSFLGHVSEEALRRINTLVKLERKPVPEIGSDEWSPYRSEGLPGSPILPSFGIEQYGLPIPRKNAEAWRQYDVTGLVGTDYSGSPAGTGSDLNLDESQMESITAKIKANGAWLDDDDSAGRLVYVNGRFVPSLSFTSDIAKNLSSDDFTSGNVNEEITEKMDRLTDGFTDRLAADVPSGDTEFLTSMKDLSGPNHNVGEPTSQFSINNQQGTACFVAMNSVRAGSVSYINSPAGVESKPVIIVNVNTADGGLENGKEGQGVSWHPRTVVTAGDKSEISVVQSFIDLDDADASNSNPKFVNGYTQMYIGEGAKVKHSYLEESGGLVTGGVEMSDKEVDEDVESPRNVEAKRNALKDTHFEAIDVHVIGADGIYEGAVMGIGGNGRSRISVSASLLKPGTHAAINGFSLSGGAQRTDMRTLIHHIAQGTTSFQQQRNMIGGRATSTFKGRIRVEQSAQQTESEQLARTILMSDKARIWAIPSLEIIADDVVCTHGATVSDLSEEELFYLRSRGVDRTTARNILMYGFVDEVSATVEEAIQGDKDDPVALKNRVIKRLQNLVPQGEKILVGGEFQSV